jgi:sulfoxide reductase heme-binding subunit YedZ
LAPPREPKLHCLVYVAAAAATTHFVLVVKSWPPEPIVYAAIITGRLLFRFGAYLRRGSRPSVAAS